MCSEYPKLRESKEDRFKRLAVARTNKALDMIRLIGNLSSELTYRFTEEQVDKVFNALEKEMRVQRKRFRFVNEPVRKRFVLRVEDNAE